ASESGYVRRRPAAHLRLPAIRSAARPSGPWHRQTVPASTNSSRRRFWLAIVAAWDGASILAGRLSIGEAAVAETGADRKHSPVRHVAHERRLAQALHHRVIVHNDHRVVLADGRNGRM